ncbi:MAG: YbbR-like domain-containing protein [Leptospirales bacterium]
MRVRERIRRTLKRHLLLKTLALFLALLLWFQVSRKGQEYLSVQVPVTFSRLPAHMELVGTEPQLVTLTISGPPGLSHRIAPNSLRLLVNGSLLGAGSQRIDLSPSMVSGPQGIRINSISPNSVRLRIEAMIQKKIPLYPEYIASIQAAIPSFRVSLIPDYARVEGDEQTLKKLKGLGVSPIDLSLITNSPLQILSIPLTAPTNAHFQILSPKTVLVRIQKFPGKSHPDSR